MSGHISPKSTYITIFGALMVCTILTVLAAFINLGNLNFPVAITIAVFKATLVVLFFMHVKYSTKLTQLWAMTGFIWVTLLTIILLDYGTRRYEPVPVWSNDTGSALPRATYRQNLPPDESTFNHSEGGGRVIRPRQ